MWDAFDPNDWEAIPYITGRMATEEDVKAGIAVFYLPNGGIACDADLPICAIHVDVETGERTPVVIIQAEQSGNLVSLGLRYIDGGNGICTFEEVELLQEPNHEFGI